MSNNTFWTKLLKKLEAIYPLYANSHILYKSQKQIKAKHYHLDLKAVWYLISNQIPQPYKPYDRTSRQG